MWNEAGCGKPRCATMPLPSPDAAWQGTQKMPYWVRPRSSIAAVICAGCAIGG